jgi:hypothetical protein
MYAFFPQMVFFKPKFGITRLEDNFAYVMDLFADAEQDTEITESPVMPCEEE